MRRAQTIAALLTGCAALLMTGCSGGGTAADSAAAPAVAAERATRMPAKPDRAADGDGASAVAGVQVTRQDRQVIYTGRMTVRVKDVTAAAEQAKEAVTAAGGHLAREESHSSGRAEASAELEFKIPPSRYAGLVARLGEDLGERLSLNQQTEDVTLQVADVESRVKSAERALESLRTLLAKADTIGQVLGVAREIARRAADLASLQAQQQRLAAQPAMATLPLRLVGLAAPAPDDEPAGFLGGLRAGWDSLVAFLSVLVAVVGAVLPWLAVITPPAVLAAVVLRRRRRRTREPSPSEA